MSTRTLQYEKPMLDTIAFMSKRYKSIDKWIIKHSELSYMGATEKAFVDLMVDKGHFVSSSERKAIQPNSDVSKLFNHIQARYDQGLDVSLILSEPLLDMCNLLEDFDSIDKYEFIKQKYIGKILLDVPINIDVRAKVVDIKVKDGVEYLELEVQPMKAVDNILVSIDEIAKG